MPRYNLRTLRGERVAKKKEGERMTKWKSEYERFVNDSRNVLSVEEVREEILLILEDNAIEQTKVSLICPCFDLKGFLAMKAKRNFLECPICNAKISNELNGLCIDKYFQKILSEINNATEAEILRDSTYREVPAQLAFVIPKVIDDEEPYLDYSTTYIGGVKSETEQNLPQIEESDSVATSIVDGQNEDHHGFGESMDESETTDEESECGPETEEETLTNNTRAQNKKKENQLKNSLKRAVNGEKRHKCKLCHYATNKRRNLTRHMRTHTGEKPFKCKTCNYAAARQSTLIVHKRIHTGERPFKCDNCNYEAIQQHHLTEHIRIHTGEKPYKCRFCEFATARSNDLTKHIRIHTGEKPYKCRFCEFASGYGQSLNRHMRTQHKDALKLD
ncbi:zinc-finger double domain-containing protein [Ditylenchus destructor]|nr:zinc-finger double domain-containing protein [Ditylenchus destructor]